MKSYYEQYARLLSLTNLVTRNYTDSQKELDASLKRTSAFLKVLGSPEKKMDFIHVAGTSGKGSVVNNLHHILHTNGDAVGSYTSPHTTTYLERFHFGEGLLKPGLLAQSIEHLIEAYDPFLKKHDWLSFFELSTCLAIYSLQRAGAEWCVLETGCGGRFDATNVIPKPVVAIITNVDKDHTEVLGNTLGQIAKAKAGIMKRHGVVLCGETRPALKKIFQKEALQKDASLFFVSSPSTAILNKESGFEQQHNAALAKRAALELGVKESIIKRANKTLQRLPCRFETMQTSPMVILDGAHAPAKIASTVKLIKALKKPVRVLYGAVHNKDSQVMLRDLSNVATHVSTTRFLTSFRKAAEPHQLLSMVPAKKRGQAYLEPRIGLEKELQATKSNEVLVVTGSLYLAGELRQKWIPESQIIKRASSF